TLRFGDLEKPLLVTTAALPPVAYSYAEDWALLQCTQVPEAVPIELAVHDPAYDKWDTFGFPKTLDSPEGNRGQVYEGRIVQSGLSIQLQVNESGPKTMSAGISGSPLLVGREAVGVIVESLRDEDDHNVEGTLWARALNVDELTKWKLSVK